MKFWNFVDSGEEVELRIDGEIVPDNDAWLAEFFGAKAMSPNDFRQMLASYRGRDITVWIDSIGGDVFAAVGIYNALKEHNGKITVKIDGKALSAASLVAMAGDQVLMSPGSLMMIHNPWTGIVGDAHEMRHMATVLDEVKDAIINVYQSKTKLSRAKLARMMDEETWMSAKKAVAEGFADGILYAESAQEPISALAFSRLAIQNSVSSSINSFIKYWKTHKSDETLQNRRKWLNLLEKL